MSAGNPFAGKFVAIAGKLVNYTRAGIKNRLLNLGAKPVSVVSTRTSYLIVGEKPGSKLAKAQMLGISIMSEQEFEDATGSSINGGGS